MLGKKNDQWDILFSLVMNNFDKKKRRFLVFVYRVMIIIVVIAQSNDCELKLLCMQCVFIGSKNKQRKRKKAIEQNAKKNENEWRKSKRLAFIPFFFLQRNILSYKLRVETPRFLFFYDASLFIHLKR